MIVLCIPIDTHCNYTAVLAYILQLHVLNINNYAFLEYNIFEEIIL